MRRVVITGLGVLAPNAHGPEEFASALRHGQSGIRRDEEMAAVGLACQVSGLPQNVDQLQARCFDPVDLRGMDQSAVFGAIAALDAWADAGLKVGGETDWDTGISFGTGVGGVETIARQLVPATDAGRARRMGSAVPERIMHSAIAARIATFLAAGGPVSSCSSACASGVEAIINGCWMIREGRALRVLAGGAEGDSVYIRAAFGGMRVMSSSRNEMPASASRPLSSSADGFVPAAGAGAVVLEALESAVLRGARIYAEVRGAAVNCGGQRNGGTMTAPNPEDVQRCIRRAVREAGIQPREIDLISGHLTATMADVREVCNWRIALGLDVEDFPLVNAPKSMLGHALGAAGAIESVATILQLHQGFVHPSINCEDFHPALHWCQEKVPVATIEKELRIAAKAGFGFGDVNACIIFERFNQKGA